MDDLNVAKEGLYDLEAVISGWKQGDLAGAFRIEFDGDDQTGELVAPNTGK